MSSSYVKQLKGMSLLVRAWQNMLHWRWWKWKSLSRVDSLRPRELYSPWRSPGQNTGVVIHSLRQGIFLTQGSNPALPCCRWVLYQLGHHRRPRTLEWVALPFSSMSSPPRNRTGVSRIAGRFLSSWATREALHWRKEWQTTSVSLPWEPHEQ